jgi:hypothetical protein
MSSQRGAVPGPHEVVAEQTSAPLQKSPSLQNRSSGVCTQPPDPSTHASTVQRMPSSHTSGVPGVQLPR